MNEKKLDEIKEELTKIFECRHPRFIDLTIDEMDLHSRKNADYAKGGDPLGNFNRVANILSNYPNLDLSRPSIVVWIYLMKQLDAVLWMMSQNYVGQVEGIQDRLRDIHVYAKLIRILEEERNGR